MGPGPGSDDGEAHETYFVDDNHEATSAEPLLMEAKMAIMQPWVSILVAESFNAGSCWLLGPRRQGSMSFVSKS